MSGRVVAVNTSLNKGEKKFPVDEVVLKLGRGVEGDAHAGGARQVSLLAQEHMDAVDVDMVLSPGDFGENVTTEGIDLSSLNIGDRITVGQEAILQISEIGKICHSPCSIGQRLGECIMPRYGMFAKVLKSGIVRPGDAIERCSQTVGAVLTSSDRCARGERDDESGPILINLLDELGVALADYAVLPDEEAELSQRLTFWADRCGLDVILTTGGTGFTSRDRTPEATLAVLDSPAPGIAEAIRQEGLRHTPLACLSRAVSGLRGRTLIVNLPGSPRAISESLSLLRTVIPHILQALRGELTDCGTLHRS